jgi:peptidyl-prolyl cis-trans isomerase B (cyclophilin B)
VRKNSRDLDGKYAAFGKITSGMEIIDRIYENLKTDENGMISEKNQPVITSISSHASHGH